MGSCIWGSALDNEKETKSRVFSCERAHQSRCCGVGWGGGWGRLGEGRSLFDQPLGYVSVRYLDLLVTGAGVGELLARVGDVQVLPDGRHLFGDVEASVLLGHHLQRKRKGSEVYEGPSL